MFLYSQWVVTGFAIITLFIHLWALKIDILENTRKSYIALIIGALLLSISPVLIKMTGAPGTVTAFYRLVFGTLTLLIPFIISRFRSKTSLPIKGILLAAAAGLCLAIDMAFWTTGIMASNAAMPTLTGNLAPLWVGIGSYFIFKERKTRNFWVGLFIALLGVFFLILHDFYFPTGIFKGLILGLIAGFFYAGFMLFVQPGRKQLNTISFLFISTLATTLFLGLFVIIQGLPFVGYSSYSWRLFILLGVLIQAGAWFLLNFSQGHLPASLVSPTLLTQPVLAAVLAWFLLGEALGIWHIVGGLIVVFGIYMVHFSKPKKGVEKTASQ